MLLGALASCLEDRASQDIAWITEGCVAVHCKPAVALAERVTAPCDRWMYLIDIAATRRRLAKVGIRVGFLCVPSHGKEVDHWIPDFRFGEELLRELDQRADDVAMECLKPFREHRTRKDWILQQEAAR